MNTSAPPRPLLPEWTPVLPDDGDDGIIDRPPDQRSLAREVVGIAGAALVIAFLVKTFVAQAFFIPSGSMLPTLEVDDRVVVSRAAYRLHDPHRGDIVVFESPRGEKSGNGDGGVLPVRLLRGFFETVGVVQPSTDDFIKRVVALPGESVEGKDGKVFIDGTPLDEPYLEDPGSSSFGPVTVPEDHLWVMGDNRGASSDSRVFGPISQDSVVGRAIMRIWPPSRVGFL